jgi:hypothetical protein
VEKWKGETPLECEKAITGYLIVWFNIQMGIAE